VQSNSLERGAGRRLIKRPLAAPPLLIAMPNYCFACAAETDKWKKISFVFLPVVGLYMGFVAVRHNSHGHHEYEQVRPTAYHPSPPTVRERR
jgi:hypothetical protein